MEKILQTASHGVFLNQLPHRWPLPVWLRRLSLQYCPVTRGGPLERAIRDGSETEWWSPPSKPHCVHQESHTSRKNALSMSQHCQGNRANKITWIRPVSTSISSINPQPFRNFEINFQQFPTSKIRPLRNPSNSGPRGLRGLSFSSFRNATAADRTSSSSQRMWVLFLVFLKGSRRIPKKSRCFSN